MQQVLHRYDKHWDTTSGCVPVFFLSCRGAVVATDKTTVTGYGRENYRDFL